MGEAVCKGLHAAAHFLIEAVGKALLGFEDHDCAVRVVQEALVDEFFKKSLVLLLAEEVEILSDFQADERFCVVVEPGVEGVEAVDQASGIRTEICFAIAEFIKVDSSLEGTGIDSFLSDFGQCVTNGGNKLVLAAGIRVF